MLGRDTEIIVGPFGALIYPRRYRMIVGAILIATNVALIGFGAWVMVEFVADLPPYASK